MSQPVYVMREGHKVDKNAFSENLLAAQAIAELIKTTFGPKGMEKMLFDRGGGSTTITNDSGKILEEIEVGHPGGKIIIKLVKAHKKDIGDGTTRLILFTSALLSAAKELIDEGYHPTIISRGFTKAKNHALKTLNELATKFDVNDKDILKKIAKTTLNSKPLGNDLKEKFAEISSEAVSHVKQQHGEKWIVDLDDIMTLRKMGQDVGTTELINGLVIDKELLNIMMPNEVHDAKIAIIDSAFEIVKTNFDSQVMIDKDSDVQLFKDKESSILKALVDAVVKSGANVVFCQKGIDEGAQRYLNQNGIFAVRRVKKSDMYRIAKATGGQVINDIKNIKAEDLGRAGLVIERKIGQDRLIFIEQCKDPKSVSIFIRGFRFAEAEVEDSIKNALNTLRLAVENPYYIPGAGAVFIELAESLSNFASTLPNKEQLVAEIFAKALDSIPIILAENGGLNPIDIHSELNAAHKNAGAKNIGVDFDKKGTSDMIVKGVIEPLDVMAQIIKAATELSNMLLNIDEVIDKKGN